MVSKGITKTAQQRKEEIMGRIAHGRRSGESTQEWLSDAERLTKEHEKVIGRRETANAWMRGIAELAMKEDLHNAELTGIESEIFGLLGTRHILSEDASRSLEDLNAAQEFALSKEILSRRELDKALAAANTIIKGYEEAAREHHERPNPLEHLKEMEDNVYAAMEK
jgi:hypothetical protein